MISNAEVARLAAEAAGVAPPQRSIPLPVSYALAAAGTIKGKLRGTDERLSLESLRLMRAEAEAAKFWVGLRAAKRARNGS